MGLPEGRRLFIGLDRLGIGLTGNLLLDCALELLNRRAHADALRPDPEPPAHVHEVRVRASG